MIAIALVFVVLLGGLALLANARFRGEARLPMQWWVSGAVTWSAPRSLALAFYPLLGAAMLGGYVVLARTMLPRAGQEQLVLPTLVILGALFVAMQLLHYWLIALTLRRRRH